MPVVSVEKTAAPAPCPAEIQRLRVVGVENLGFGEAVVDLEHPGRPAGTETHPEWAAVGRKSAAATLVGVGVGHLVQAVDEETGVGHLILAVVGIAGP